MVRTTLSRRMRRAGRGAATGALALLALAPAAGARVTHPGIVGGGPVTSIADRPFQAALLDGGRTGQFCGGVVLDARHVLTAGHCIGVAPTRRLSVLVGSLRLSTGGLVVAASAQTTIPGFTGGPAPTSDAGVITLTAPLDLATPDVRAGSLTGTAAQDRVTAGTTLTVSGWGLTQVIPGLPDTLQSVAVAAVSDAACATAFPGDLVADTMLCALGSAPPGHQDACNGDSGGPLTRDDPAQTVVGLVSWGPDPCATVDPGVYTELAGPGIAAGIQARATYPASAPVLIGSATVGQDLSCSPGTWTPAPTTMTFAFETTLGTVLQEAGPAPTLTVPASATGLGVVCAVTAVSPAGTVLARSAAGEPVAAAPAPPAPLPPAPPAPGPDPTQPGPAAGAPRATILAVRCRRGTCTIRLRVGAGARVVVNLTPLGHQHRGRRVAPGPGGTATVSFRRVRHGRLRISARAFDQAGRTQSRASVITRRYGPPVVPQP